MNVKAFLRVLCEYRDVGLYLDQARANERARRGLKTVDKRVFAHRTLTPAGGIFGAETCRCGQGPKSLPAPKTLGSLREARELQPE